LPDSQAGFKRGRGLRWIMEKCHEHQKNIYICFINYSKAFDCIEHDKLWKALIRSFYKDQEATVRTQHEDTEWFKIEKGCILSPFLFNLYAEMIMRKIGNRLKIGGRNINNLHYADDTTLLAETEDDLKYLILRIKKESEKMSLNLNIKKTKIMTTAVNGEVKITINNEEIESVKVFCFLGSMIDRTGDCSPEIRRRLLR
uniref:Reverse transcriptase domain-containing protein n=1 Tax=Lepisosteus oculatus TaxID=7918 RepID=W5MWE0_LEPOC